MILTSLHYSWMIAKSQANPKCGRRWLRCL